MTRIVGGAWRGRRLVTPVGETTRPTSEKVRAALASSLTATGGLEGARVLDLYAGSGALGLELVSRGASSAVFVERDRAALVALRANVATLGAAATGSPAVRRQAGVGLSSSSAGEASSSAGEASSSAGEASSSAGDTAGHAQRLVVVAGDAAAFVTRGVGAGTFDVVVADPPYELPSAALLAIFADLELAGMLAPQADLVLERSVRSGEPTWPHPLEGVRSRKYGDTLLCYGRAP